MWNNRIIIGTAQFGAHYGINNLSGIPDQREIFEILDYALNVGVNTVDTADAYGNATEIIGLFNLKNYGRLRINTKFILNNVGILDQLEKSLSSLRTDNINVYFFHSFGDFLNYPSISEDLMVLKDNGKISKTGISVYDNNEFRKAIESSIIDVIQFPFNLLDNLSQREALIKHAKSNGKELQARSVFLQGLFFKEVYALPHFLTPLKPHLNIIARLVNDYKITTEQLALSYVLQQQEINNVIIGIDNLNQLKRNLEFNSFRLPEEVTRIINDIVVEESHLLYPKNWS